jgi:hypothetical protein
LTLLLLGERVVGERGVDADAEDGGVEVVEAGERVAERAQLLLADAGERGGEEGEDDGLAAQARERDLLAGVGEQGEIGGRGAGLQHGGIRTGGPGTAARGARRVIPWAQGDGRGA